MTSITASQKKILNALIFVEPHTHIAEETGLSRGEIRDDLTTLMHKNMIEVYEAEAEGIGNKVRHFDNDHPESYYYRATKAGLDALSTSP
ncbi:hypothetical protein QLX67_01575 [Balneolaceae bacterium ANBcel3]|nr:hypothetical protein [Balneolaceae bacterium ANBcel3]